MAAAIDACYGGSEQANCPTAAAKLPQIYFNNKHTWCGESQFFYLSHKMGGACAQD
jgi:hypothetical protein